MEPLAGNAHAVEAGGVAVADIDPEQAAFVVPLDRRVVKQPRVGAIGAAPAAVGHPRVVGGGNAAGEQLAGGRFEHAVDQRAEAADAGDEVHAVPPGAEIGGPLVGQDFLDDAGQVGRRVGGNAADGQVGQVIVVEVGIPVVAGDFRLAPPLDVDDRLVQMHGHRAGADRGIGAGGRLGIAHEQHVLEPAAAAAAWRMAARIASADCVLLM